MTKKQTRKEQLHDRINRFADANRLEVGLTFEGLARGYRRGYEDARKEVRRAVGKCQVPSALVKLLRPLR